MNMTRVFHGYAPTKCMLLLTNLVPEAIQCCHQRTNVQNVCKLTYFNLLMIWGNHFLLLRTSFLQVKADIFSDTDSLRTTQVTDYMISVSSHMSFSWGFFYYFHKLPGLSLTWPIFCRMAGTINAKYLFPLGACDRSLFVVTKSLYNICSALMTRVHVS